MSRHIRRNHENFKANVNNYNIYANENTFDLRLKENFKMFITGPSRCGKTVFISQLLENIYNFAKQLLLKLYMYTKFGSLNLMIYYH